jgi:anti-sigma factor RsiW
MSANAEILCERNLIAAYVDGELDDSLRLPLELHLDSCVPCRAELRAHRLFVCELDAVLTQKSEVEVPANFSRLVAARAVSDMRGVRSAAENKKAFTICVILAVTGFVLVGATARQSLMNVTRGFFAAVWRVGGFVWSATYDTGVSITVVMRVVARRVLVETDSLVALMLVLALAVFLLSRLISNYHRTGATE